MVTIDIKLAEPEAESEPLLDGRISQVVDRIEPSSLRARVREGLEVCSAALRVIDALDLARHEMADPDETANLEVWDALAPRVRDVLFAVRTSSERLRSLFPRPPSLEQSTAAGSASVPRSMAKGSAPIRPTPEALAPSEATAHAPALSQPPAEAPAPVQSRAHAPALSQPPATAPEAVQSRARAPGLSQGGAPPRFPPPRLPPAQASRRSPKSLSEHGDRTGQAGASEAFKPSEGSRASDPWKPSTTSATSTSSAPTARSAPSTSSAGSPSSACYEPAATAEGAGPVERFDRGRAIDALVDRAASRAVSAIGEAVGGLAAMLDLSFKDLGAKLRNPRIVADRWFLLGELHDFRRNCTECLEATMAAVLGGCSDEPMDELLPRYSNAMTRALVVRAAVVDLSADITFFNEAMRREDADVAQLLLVMEERLSKFAKEPAFAILDPADRRAAILLLLDLRRVLREGRADDHFRGMVEDYSKYLEMMMDMNRREELIVHDRSHLEAACMILDSGVSDVRTAMASLLLVYGRSEALDAVISAMRVEHRTPPLPELRAVIEATLGRMNALG